MQCFSLVADKQVIPVPATSHFPSIPTVHIASELYPKARPGLVVSKANMAVWLGGESVQVSRRFLNKGVSAEHAVQGSDTIKILRASLVRHADDSLELIQERVGDESGALVLLDLGSGSYSSLRYDDETPEILIRVRQRRDFLFGSEESALALLRPGRALSAYRSDRRWLFFGKNVLREELKIDFDGSNVGYQVINVDGAKAE